MVDSSHGIDTIFRALGDPSRLQMVERLASGPLTVGALAQPFDMSLAGASKHVGVLEAAGVIRREKRGRERLCTLRSDRLEEARAWVEHYSAFWSERLDALEQVLAADGRERNDG